METKSSNFLRAIIEQHRREGRYKEIVTRFPPEPNGYLHIGHCKSIVVNFGLAEQYGGRCHLRFDDTNPTAEKTEFVENIKNDIRWLGFDWGEHLYHASDYFQQLYDWALRLIREGHAYVDSLSEDEIRAYRGSVTEPGKPSPYRDRPVDESLRLLDGMRRGEYKEGEHVLRAKADMSHPNMKMRDPLMYRILNSPHDRTGDAWHIYPMYDYAHGLSDAIEGISHSICTLEFENNRALYDFFLDLVGFREPRPHQYEMARLRLPYTMMSKRKLRRLVEEGVVSGWDDPRMPTLSAYRNLGVPPQALRAFIERIGVSKANSVVDPVFLDNAIRNELNRKVKRMMAVLDPILVEISNWSGGEDWLDASLYPHDVPLEGSRRLPFSGKLYVERADVREQAGKKFRRLVPGREVRLRYGYIIRCTGVTKNEAGEIVSVQATYDPASRGGHPADNRKVPGTIHWVSAEHAVPLPIMLYERLFLHASPDEAPDYRAFLNPNSKSMVTARGEPALLRVEPGERVQFERVGYFYADPASSTAGEPRFTRIVGLKDSRKPAKKVDVPKKVVVQVAGERERTASEIEQIEALMARGVPSEEANVLVDSAELAELFEATHAAGTAVAGAAKWVVHEVCKLPSWSDLTGESLCGLVQLVDRGVITHKIGRQVLELLGQEGGSAEEIVDTRGWRSISDDNALSSILREVMDSHPEEVEAWRGGRDRLAGFFVGQVMKKTKGRADARRLNQLLQEIKES